MFDVNKLTTIRLLGKWIGFDFDGTLVIDKHPNCGKPVKSNCDRVRFLLLHGVEVKIVTARVEGFKDGIPFGQDLDEVVHFCQAMFGRELPMTNAKDYFMEELWDDRACSVEKDTGRQLAPSRIQ